MGRPVVALESTILSNLGLPSPAYNRECLDRCDAAMRGAGAVPAITAVLDGCATVGLTEPEIDRVLLGTNKVSARCGGGGRSRVGHRRDHGCCVGHVGGSRRHRGVRPEAVGGVHRRAELTGDVSADLGALARCPVVTVTAGQKAFLDLARTVEWFDTLGVPLLGYGTDEFPPSTAGHPVCGPAPVETSTEVASIVGAMRRAGERGRERARELGCDRPASTCRGRYAR